MLFLLTTCLAHPKMTVFLLYSEAQQRKSRGLEGKEEGEKEEQEQEQEEEEEYKLVDYWLATGV